MCEIEKCKQGIWTACEECDMLLCYAHSIEKVNSCGEHGTMKRTKKQKSEQEKKIAQLKRIMEKRNIQETIERENQELCRFVQELEENRQQESGLEMRDQTEIAVLNEEEQFGQNEGEKPNESIRGRKRTRNEENWARNVKKRLKNSGKSYISVRGKEVAEKTVKPACSEKCVFKCSQKFSEERRKTIFNELWDMGDKREQQHFLLRHVEERPAQRRRVGSDKRTTTFHYYFLTADLTREEVCRVFFLNTLDIKRDYVYNTIRRQSSTGLLRPNCQGKHGKQKKTTEALLQGVREHIMSFPVVDSHYCRARTERKYLDSFLSLAAMYRLYSNQCDEKGVEKVNEAIYRKVFNTEFNFGFHKPKKDQCDMCIAHKNRQSLATDEEKQEYESHISNKIMAREIKDNVKREAINSTDKTGCCFDLQQILLCPHGNSSSFYYKRRLGIYNLTFYDFKRGDVYCFMWPENEGGRGSVEVATCIFKYIEKQSKQGVKDIVLFSDNCGGQNRNRFVAFALNFACAHFQLRTITHTFLEKGHTENENDSVHATIERKVRNIEIYSPEQWYTAVRTSRTSKEPYIVIEMACTDFINFKEMASKVRNLSVDDSGDKVFWSKVRQVVAMAEDPSALQIKTCFNGLPQRLDLNRRKRESEGTIDACKLKIQKGMPKPGISQLKKRDLMSLCTSGQIPTVYRKVYESLTVSGQDEDIEDSDGD